MNFHPEVMLTLRCRFGDFLYGSRLLTARDAGFRRSRCDGSIKKNMNKKMSKTYLERLITSASALLPY